MADSRLKALTGEGGTHPGTPGPAGRSEGLFRKLCKFRPGRELAPGDAGLGARSRGAGRVGPRGSCSSRGPGIEQEPGVRGAVEAAPSRAWPLGDAQAHLHSSVGICSPASGPSPPPSAHLCRRRSPEPQPQPQPRVPPPRPRPPPCRLALAAGCPIPRLNAWAGVSGGRTGSRRCGGCACAGRRRRLGGAQRRSRIRAVVGPKWSRRLGERRGDGAWERARQHARDQGHSLG